MSRSSIHSDMDSDMGGTPQLHTPPCMFRHLNINRAPCVGKQAAVVYGGRRRDVRHSDVGHRDMP